MKINTFNSINNLPVTEFRTTFKMPSPGVKITPDHRILAIGSCFVTEMATRLTQRKFLVDQNPFGILFNPHSISTCLTYLVSGARVPDSCFVQHDERWHSLLHHGSFSRRTKKSLMDEINQVVEQSHAFLNQTDVVILTLGSAHLYRHKSTDILVANCHKIPNQLFEKTLLRLDKIITELSLAMHKIRAIRPSVHFILSVSPVRYLKDGVIENQRSKARLLLACEQLVQSIPNCDYFPAYELLVDDLRDYRFYAGDMIHPNQVAIDYIWDLFCTSYFSDQAQELSRQMEVLIRLMGHRPLRSDPISWEKYATKIRTTIQQLKEKFPDRDYQVELDQMNQN
jgi:hypothetical protein